MGRIRCDFETMWTNLRGKDGSEVSLGLVEWYFVEELRIGVMQIESRFQVTEHELCGPLEHTRISDAMTIASRSTIDSRYVGYMIEHVACDKVGSVWLRIATYSCAQVVPHILREHQVKGIRGDETDSNKVQRAGLNTRGKQDVRRGEWAHSSCLSLVQFIQAVLPSAPLSRTSWAA